MAKKYKEREYVYAIIRWDGFQGRSARPESLVTVKEIVHTVELAEAEVARLNALHEGKDIHYWWQVTRLFMPGQSAGSGED